MDNKMKKVYTFKDSDHSLWKQFSGAEVFPDGTNPMYIGYRKDAKYFKIEEKVVVADKNGFYVEYFLDDVPQESFNLNLDNLTPSIAKKLLKGFLKLNKKEYIMMGWEQVN